MVINHLKNRRNSHQLPSAIVRWLVGAIVLLLLSFSQAVAAGALTIDAGEQFHFARHCFETGAYRRAVDEYQRFIYFFPEDGRVETAMFNIGTAYFRLRSFNEAISTFQALIEKYGHTDLAVRAYWMISECYRKGGAFDAAIINLHNLIGIAGDVDIIDETYYRLGWIYVEMAEWEKARIAFAGISAQSRAKYRLEHLSAELNQESRIPKKDPTLAGVLSVLPGAGQLYIGRYQDALIAFLLNAGLMLAAYEAFDKDLYALGAVITFVEVGFYGGNIYGAAAGAHKYNRKAHREFIENLKRNTQLKLSADHRSRKWLLTINYNF